MKDQISKSEENPNEKGKESEHEFYHALGLFEIEHVLDILGKNLNYLISARMAMTDKRVIERRVKLRKYANKLFMDSGMIGAWRKRDLEWMDNQEEIIALAKKMRVDIVTMLDLPMETHLLSKNNFTQKQALKKTIENAEKFRDMGNIGIKKCYVIQGWKKHQYVDCIKKYDALNIWDDADIIGIGTMCMRTPSTGLYSIARFIIDEIKERTDAPLHCFGIARPQWVQTLFSFGIRSCDSATAAMCSSFYKIFNGTRIKLPKEINNVGSLTKRHLFAFNLLAMDNIIFKKNPQHQNLLSFEKVEATS